MKEVFGFHSNVPDHFDALIRNGFKRNLSTIPPGNLVGGAGILGLVHWIIFHRGRFPMAARLPPA